MSKMAARWINDCFETNYLFEKTPLIYCNDYVSPYEKSFIEKRNKESSQSDLRLLRDGVYSVLWNHLNGKGPAAQEAVCLESAPFFKHSPEQMFYAIEKIEKGESKIENILFFFFWEPELVALDFLETEFKRLRPLIDSYRDKNFYCHIVHGKGLEEKKSAFQFFGEIFQREKIQFRPIETLDLLKISSLSAWGIVNVGSERIVGDNFLTHLVYAKNAQPLVGASVHQFKKIVATYELSFFHRMVIGQVDHCGDSKEAKEITLFDKTSVRPHQNFLNIPPEFITFISSALRGTI